MIKADNAGQTGTVNADTIPKMASTSGDEGTQSTDEYVVVPEPAETESKQLEGGGDTAGPTTRAKSQKSSSEEAETKDQDTEEEDQEKISPIKKSVKAISKKIWAHRSK